MQFKTKNDSKVCLAKILGCQRTKKNKVKRIQETDRKRDTLSPETKLLNLLSMKVRFRFKRLGGLWQVLDNTKYSSLTVRI